MVIFSNNDNGNALAWLLFCLLFSFFIFYFFFENVLDQKINALLAF